MKIRIGTKLSINLERLEDHITAFYVGEKKGQHIALTFPDKNSAYTEKIKEQNEIRVQYFDNNIRYEFKSKVIKLLEDPVDLIVLEYPSEIYPVDQRSLDRINCLVSAKVKNPLDNDNPPVTGVIANINKTGCLCSLTNIENSKTSFSMGDRVDLKCQFPGLVGEQSAGGKIVRIQKEEKEIVLGIHFDNEVWWIPPYDRK